ncbi:hypothetical protein D3C71_1857430 [compost metagenome]
MALAFFSRPNAIASSVAVSQACSAVTTSKRSGMDSRRADSATDMFRKRMRSKPSCAASACEASTSGARVSMP